jgi:hypothetical protein
MKLLLDECLPIKLKSLFPNLEVKTVNEMGWKSVKNGTLLNIAVENKFDFLITIDKKLEYQHDIHAMDIGVIVFEVEKCKLEFLSPLVPKIINQLYSFKRGEVYYIGVD